MPSLRRWLAARRERWRRRARRSWRRAHRRVRKQLPAALVRLWAVAAHAGLPVIVPWQPGARWLSRAFADPRVQRRVQAHAAIRYRPHPAWTVAASADPWDRERFLTSFFFPRWRLHALEHAPAPAFARDVSVEGWEQFEKARAAGRGVIFLSAHFGLDPLIPVLLTRLGIPVFAIQNVGKVRPVGFRHMSPAQGRPLLSRATLEACRELARGGSVVVVGDGGAGRKRGDVEAPFLGGTQRFTPTFAVLVRRTGAIPVPLVAVPAPGGRIRLRLFPPLPAPDRALPRDAWLASFVARYAAWLEARWREDPLLIGRYYWRIKRDGSWDPLAAQLGARA